MNNKRRITFFIRFSQSPDLFSLFRFFFIFICFVPAGLLRAQCVPNNQDCIDAIPVCQSTYTQTNSYLGSGCDANEINKLISCLGAGEKNDVWYTFTVQKSGILNFSIIPSNGTDDYDWALFNLTNNSCKDIFNDTTVKVSCNFANNKGCGGVTGANGQTTGTCGPQNEPVIPVLAGQVYVLNVSHYSANQYGYILDLGQSTAEIFDTTHPRLQSVTMLHCTGDSVLLTFNKNIVCSTVSPGNFTISGPGGPYTITSVYSPSCAIGLPYGRRFTLITSPPLTLSGTYTVLLANPPTDVCGNVSSANSALQFSLEPIFLSSDTVIVHCNKNNSSLQVTPGGGEPPFAYSWTPNVSNNGLASNVNPGTYTVSLTDANNCNVIHTFTVVPSPPMTLTLSPRADTLCKGKSATLTGMASGGEGAYTYSWSNGSTGQTSTTVTPMNTGYYTFSVTDSNGCRVTDTARIQVTPYPIAVFSADTTLGCSPASILFLSDTSVNKAVSYSWSFGDSTSSTLATPTHTYTNPGCYDVGLVVTSADGYCSSSVKDSCMIRVIAKPTPSFSANPNETDILTPSVQFTDNSLNANNWHWNFGDDSTSLSMNPSHTYGNPGQYPVVLIVTNPDGCKDSIRLNIIIHDVVSIYIPNAFTPNGDGLNDLFGPVGFHLTPANFEMYVFNRWGLQVYYTNDPDKPWNGTINNGGVPSPQDSYAYRISYQDISGKIQHLVGGFNLIR
ncbi:MAG TPA: PKD domain-containing protein [Bacteroidia bacterium]|jgi:gliding motility-associated-like protein|nr:PKD domain-containing protein [Bacteroidia bacterium]